MLKHTMIDCKCLILFWLLVKIQMATSNCGADMECKDFKERLKRNSNSIIKDKTFKAVEVYSDSATIFANDVWPRYYFQCQFYTKNSC